jgi:hypothetical protein
VDKADFLAWLDSAKPGDTFVYFTGPNPRAKETALAAREAFADGKVELAQRRREDGELDYLAIRRSAIGVVAGG